MSNKKGEKNKGGDGHDELSELLTFLESSPRFPLLQHLKMKNLSFGGVSFAGAFEERTLGEVVELSADGIMKLPRMDEGCKEALIGLLRTYGVPTDELTEAATIIPFRPNMESDLAPIRRGEAEAKLQDFLKELKKAPKEKLKDKTLGTYWHKSFPSAPFEEVLTFGQLLELGYENLTRKRTLHTDKILAIVDAGERFLAELAERSGLKKGAGSKPSISFVLKKVTAKSGLPKDLLQIGEPMEGRLKKILLSGEVFVATSGNRAIGVFILDLKEKVISLLAVAADIRGQGFGRALLAEAVRKAEEKKWKKVKFTLRNSSVDGAAFLQREGFRLTSVDKDYYIKKFKNEELIEDGVKARDLITFEKC